MKPPEIQKVTAGSIPEVAHFVRAERELDAAVEKHAKVLAEIRELVAVRNATLEAAEKATREQEVSCGPIELLNFVRSDNAVALYDAVGPARFTALGGLVESTEKYSIDRARFDALVLQDKVAPELVLQVVDFAPRYRKLPRFLLP
jgi:hypothetical protein